MADDKTAAERAAEQRTADRAKLWTTLATVLEPRWREDTFRGKRMDDLIALADAATSAVLAVFVPADLIRADAWDEGASAEYDAASLTSIERPRNPYRKAAGA